MAKTACQGQQEQEQEHGTTIHYDNKKGRRRAALQQLLLEDSSQYNLDYLQQQEPLHWDHHVDHHHHHHNNHNNNTNNNNDNTIENNGKNRNKNNKNPRSLHWILVKDYVSQGSIMQPLKANTFVAKDVQAICFGFLIEVFECNDDKNNNNNDNDKSIEKEVYYWAMGIFLVGQSFCLSFTNMPFLVGGLVCNIALPLWQPFLTRSFSFCIEYVAMSCVSWHL